MYMYVMSIRLSEHTFHCLQRLYFLPKLITRPENSNTPGLAIETGHSAVKLTCSIYNIMKGYNIYYILKVHTCTSVHYILNSE